jgi:hypothetical protein
VGCPRNSETNLRSHPTLKAERKAGDRTRATEKVDYVSYEPVMLQVSKVRACARILEQLADGRTA